MPGFSLGAFCSCGFSAAGLMVGASQQGHHELLSCHQCKTLHSVWIETGDKGDRECSGCHNQLSNMANRGNWGPSELQENKENSAPWLITGRQSSAVRYRCPACGKISLDLRQDGCFWD